MNKTLKTPKKTPTHCDCTFIWKQITQTLIPLNVLWKMSQFLTTNQIELLGLQTHQQLFWLLDCWNLHKNQEFLD